MPGPDPKVDQFCYECRSGAHVARYAGLPAQDAEDLDWALSQQLDRADVAALYESWNASLTAWCLRCGAHLAQQATDGQAPSMAPSAEPGHPYRLPRLDVLDPDFIATVDQQTLLGALLENALNSVPVDAANVQLVAPDQRGLYIAAQQGFGRPFLDFFAWVGDDGSACASAASEGRTVTVPNVLRSLLFTDASRQAMLDAGSYAVQSFPLLSSSRQLLGVFSCHYHKVGRPSDDVAPLLSALARAAGRALQRSAQEVGNGSPNPSPAAQRRADGREPGDPTGRSPRKASGTRKIVTGIYQFIGKTS